MLKRRFLFAALAVAACGGKTPEPQTPASPPPSATGADKPGDGSAAKATAQEAQGFADAVAKYEPLKGKYDQASCSQALDIWTKAADANDKIVEARYNLGAVQEGCGDLNGAEASFKKALEIKSGFAPALAGLGSIAAKKGNVQEAESYFRRTLETDKANPTARRNLALIMLERAKAQRNVSSVAKEIVEHLRYALAADSTDIGSYTAMALVFYYEALEKGNDKSKLELAQLVCEQAKGVNPNAAPVYNALGTIWLAKKNVTAALSNFRKAVELDPRFLEAYMNIGAVTLSFRDYAGAEQAFRKALELSPNAIDAAIGLGVALRGQRKFDEAEAQYKAAEKIDARSCAVPFNLGLLYQDYKGSGEQSLKQAQGYFRDFVARCGSTQPVKAKEAEVRIKNIDETIDAIRNAAVLQKQAEEAARRSEEEAKKAGAAQPAAEGAGDKKEEKK